MSQTAPIVTVSVLLAFATACAISPIVNPIATGNVEAAARLLDSGADPNGSDRKGRTLLELTVLRGRPEIARLLVARGANVNQVGAYGNTPLQWTTERGTGELAAIFIEGGADVNAPGRLETPPLIVAIERGKFDVAALIIEAGADVNARGGRGGGTALHVAIVKNSAYLVQLLVARGASLEEKNSQSQTPHSLAKSLGQSGPVMDALEGRLVVSRTTATAKPAKPQPQATPPRPQATPPRPAPPPVTPVEVERDRTPPTIAGRDFMQTTGSSVEIDLFIRDESAVREVRLDGRRVTLRADGHLRTQRAVPEGNSLILVTAVDEWGNESSHEIRVAREIARPAPSSPVVAQAALLPPSAAVPTRGPDFDFGSFHALVIGNNDYDHLPRLRTPINDAISVSEVLRDDYGFEVHTLLNSTRAEVLDAFTRLRGSLTLRDNLLIFYAGHGWLDDAADQGYWLPVDATRDSRVQWISNADVTAAVRAMEAKHVLVVADSCYSGKLTRGLAIKNQASSYLQELAKKRARVVLTSGGLEPVEDGTGTHSIFAEAVIASLRENEGVLVGHDLFERIRRPVILGTDQIPNYGDLRRAGHEGGDFLFVRPR